VLKRFRGDALHGGRHSQLQQVFTNLFINAADAMDGKGKLTVKARFDQERSAIVIHVCDTGRHSRELGIRSRYFLSPNPSARNRLAQHLQNIIKIHGGNFYLVSA
jgi:hypothetical protein